MIYFDKRHITSPNFGKIRFKPVVGGKYKAKGKFGTIEVKDLVVDEFVVYEIRTNIKKVVTLHTASSHGVWFTYLKTSRPSSLTIDGKVTFSGREFNFFFHPQYKASCRFRKGKSTVISIHYTEDFLKKWQAVHPRFSKFLRAIAKRKEAALSEQPINISAGMVAAVSKLFLESEELVEIFRYKTIVELFRLSVLQSESNKPVIKVALQSRVRNEVKLGEAIRYINRNLGTLRTIQEIPKAVGLTYRKFVQLFHAKYGMPVYRFVYEQRMKEARRLVLKTNMTVEEISRELGYKNQSNLSNRFKNYFGVAAFAMRRAVNSRD